MLNDTSQANHTSGINTNDTLQVKWERSFFSFFFFLISTGISEVFLLGSFCRCCCCYYFFNNQIFDMHDDVIKWKHFPRYWPSPITGEFHSQRSVTRSFDVFFDLRLYRNSWANNGDVCDLRRYLVHYDVIVMISWMINWLPSHDQVNITTIRCLFYSADFIWKSCRHYVMTWIRFPHY